MCTRPAHASGESVHTSNERGVTSDSSMSSVPATRKSVPKRSATYKQILQSSAVIGSSSMFNVFIGMLRTKILALVLGPAGFGLMGVLTTIADVARSAAELGINSSGVRQIAESVGSGNNQRVALTITVLRRTAIVLGAFGGLALALLSRQVSQFTFGTTEHTGAVALVGLVVFFRMVADGQGALLQGMRRIGDMAKGSIVGNVVGSVLTIALVYWLREDGIALSLVLGAASSVAVLWWFSRKVQIEPLKLSIGQVRQEAGALLRLGVAFMASGLLMMGAAYAVRIVLIRHEGLPAAGFYQAAWTLGGLYVGFILQAMGTDFYPRLVGVIRDNAESNRLVNEQSRVSLLLAGPGVIATMVFAPVAIHVFYTAEFAAAAEVLRWICAGMALRVISWPMGFLIVARNSQGVFIATELAWVAVNIGTSIAFVQLWGMTGIGVAFMLSYVFHALMIYPIVRRMTGFRWSRDNFLTGLLFTSITMLVCTGFLWLPPLLAYALGVIATLVSCTFSLFTLATLVSPNRLPRRLHGLLGRIRRVSRFSPFGTED